MTAPLPATGLPGGDATALALVTNSGLATAPALTLTATLPADLRYSSAMPAPSDVAGQTVTWSFPDVAYRETMTVTLTITLPGAHTVTRATITWQAAPAATGSPPAWSTATTPVLSLPERYFFPVIGRSG